MHKKIKQKVSESLLAIKGRLQQEFPLESGEKFKLVIREIAKIKHDESDPKGYQYSLDAYENAYKASGIAKSDMEFRVNISSIGLILNEKHPIFGEILDEDDTIKDDDFIEHQSEELYVYLTGVAELGYGVNE